MGPTADKWVKRIAKLVLLLCVAAGLGMGAARALSPFVTRGVDEQVALADRTERYGLGRDLIADEAARPTPRYTPYEPGAGKIAKNALPGARSLDPYAPTRTKERKARRTGADGSQYEDGLSADTSYLEDDSASRYEDAPDNRIGSRDLESALMR